jgi:hypothetical protein
MHHHTLSTIMHQNGAVNISRLATIRDRPRREALGRNQHLFTMQSNTSINFLAEEMHREPTARYCAIAPQLHKILLMNMKLANQKTFKVMISLATKVSLVTGCETEFCMESQGGRHFGMQGADRN